MSAEMKLTPFGFFLGFLVTKLNVSPEQAVEFWDLLGVFVLERAQEHDPEVTHAALVFDGENGDTIGLELNEKED